MRDLPERPAFIRCRRKLPARGLIGFASREGVSLPGDRTPCEVLAAVHKWGQDRYRVRLLAGHGRHRAGAILYPPIDAVKFTKPNTEEGTPCSGPTTPN